MNEYPRHAWLVCCVVLELDQSARQMTKLVY